MWIMLMMMIRSKAKRTCTIIICWWNVILMMMKSILFLKQTEKETNEQNHHETHTMRIGKIINFHITFLETNTSHSKIDIFWQSSNRKKANSVFFKKDFLQITSQTTKKKRLTSSETKMMMNQIKKLIKIFYFVLFWISQTNKNLCVMCVLFYQKIHSQIGSITHKHTHQQWEKENFASFIVVVDDDIHNFPPHHHHHPCISPFFLFLLFVVCCCWYGGL